MPQDENAAPVHPELSGSVPVVSFQFVEFNPRRKSRKAEAARVEVFEDGESCGWLWMSERDIKNNIREFGDSAELRKALAAYRATVPSPVSVSAG